MYLTSMWLRSPKGDLGTNLVAYEHDEPIPEEEDLEDIPRDPTPGSLDAERYAKESLPSGGNHVRGYIDFVCRGNPSADEVEALLREFEREKVEGSNENPTNEEYQHDAGETYIAFSVNIGLEAPDSRRDIYDFLSKALIEWAHDGFPEEKMHHRPRP